MDLELIMFITGGTSLEKFDGLIFNFFSSMWMYHSQNKELLHPRSLNDR